MPKTVAIIGAGPAGLTAALELLDHAAEYTPIVFEASDDLGGISKTVNYKGNRIDIGGHRFFSKSDRVMDWWQKILPLEKAASEAMAMPVQQQKSRELHGDGDGPDPDEVDEVMLVRSRLSRIYYNRKFFNYPVTLETQTIRNLGIGRMAKIGFSYLWARLRPLKEVSLEEFYVNRFGRELYNTFFKSYTEKVWGVPVNEIEPDWGAQRVKGLSITKTLAHALKKAFANAGPSDVRQKDTETSLIEYFLYPKFGPGQLWETVARMVNDRGGSVTTKSVVTAINVDAGKVISVDVLHTSSGKTETVAVDEVISTMPINELVASLTGVEVPSNVAEVASKLPYRDFITVGLLLSKLKIRNETDRPTVNGVVPDNWIYIQEPDVLVGRLQVFNNWSPYMVANPDTVWVGMEYFVQEGDDLWNMADDALVNFGAQELSKIGIIDEGDVLDGTILRVKKTYPAYFGVYKRFDEIREFTDAIDNLYLVGRNGMHRYNNQDHSMLTAMAAVDAIKTGSKDKSAIWEVNVDQEYHEEKSQS
jgi:protoporphyrinogen oxidase